jgi:hypothetical protein
MRPSSGSFASVDEILPSSSSSPMQYRWLHRVMYRASSSGTTLGASGNVTGPAESPRYSDDYGGSSQLLSTRAGSTAHSVLRATFGSIALSPQHTASTGRLPSRQLMSMHVPLLQQVLLPPSMHAGTAVLASPPASGSLSALRLTSPLATGITAESNSDFLQTDTGLVAAASAGHAVSGAGGEDSVLTAGQDPYLLSGRYAPMRGRRFSIDVAAVMRRSLSMEDTLVRHSARLLSPTTTTTTPDGGWDTSHGTGTIHAAAMAGATDTDNDAHGSFHGQTGRSSKHAAPRGRGTLLL